jgi:hypothetical protein
VQLITNHADTTMLTNKRYRAECYGTLFQSSFGEDCRSKYIHNSLAGMLSILFSTYLANMLVTGLAEALYVIAAFPYTTYIT